MEIKTLEQLAKASSLDGYIHDFKNFDSEVRTLLLQLHPDKFPDAISKQKANDAFQQVNMLRDEFKRGKRFDDDSGECRTNGYFLTMKGNPALLKQSFDNYKLLSNLTPTGFDFKHFRKYMPSNMTFENNEINVNFTNKAVPLTNLALDQVHVNWLASRIFEYVAMLSQLGYTHVGLNPESIFVVPETHGIKVISFYHLTKLDTKMATISGRYKHWYPKHVFDNKIATAEIDLELSKRIAVYLLGDQSGSGVKLKTSQDAKYLNLLQRSDKNPYKFYDEYRKYIKDNFKPEFIQLSI